MSVNLAYVASSWHNNANFSRKLTISKVDFPYYQLCSEVGRNMKRRNVDSSKLRRQLRRSRITEGFYGSTLVYLKFLMVWALVLFADFILEFRFEYLWSFWLLLRSIYDSYRYQGLAFSVFFVCIALTSDMICFLYIPVHWLFFVASTYVWVQYVWQTERGVCLPTVSLWLLFVYIEASVRLKEFKSFPFHLDLCRPFAAHCVGYPVVTLGFGFKSYVGYRVRQRKQKDVQQENEFYMQLLQQALPPQQPSITNATPDKGVAQKNEEGISNGSVPHVQPQLIDKLNNKKNTDIKLPDDTAKTQEKNLKYQVMANGTNIHSELEYLEKRRGSVVNDLNEADLDKDKSIKATIPSKASPGSKWNNNVSTLHKEKRTKNNKDTVINTPSKEDQIIRLETDVKRLKADLQSSRGVEAELRSQMNVMVVSERTMKQEITQLQQNNDSLQTKLHSLVSLRQGDKQKVSNLEKQLAEERRSKQQLESQLSSERKEAARQVANHHTSKSTECCSELCRMRKRDAETEIKTARREIKTVEEKLRQSEREAIGLRQYKDSHNETEILMSALSAMQEKNTHLESSLSAETKLKLDLFSALGEAKRQLEISQKLLILKETEIEDLKSKVAEVMAVMPATDASGSLNGPVSPNADSLYSSRLLSNAHSGRIIGDDSVNVCSSPTGNSDQLGSKLDPSASVFTPKSIILTAED